eukprot:Awhi_evm1s2698
MILNFYTTKGPYAMWDEVPCEGFGNTLIMCPPGVNCCPQAQRGCDYVNCNTLDANGNNVARTVFCCQTNMNNCCPLVAAQTKEFKLANK